MLQVQRATVPPHVSYQQVPPRRLIYEEHSWHKEAQFYKLPGGYQCEDRLATFYENAAMVNENRVHLRLVRTYVESGKFSPVEAVVRATALYNHHKLTMLHSKTLNIEIA